MELISNLFIYIIINKLVYMQKKKKKSFTYKNIFFYFFNTFYTILLYYRSFKVITYIILNLTLFF